MKPAALALVLAVLATPPFAGPPERDTQNPASVDATTKPAWAWTDEERIAARVDPARIATRLRESQETQERDLASSAHVGAQPADVIIGRVHPELFLPSELFRHMATNLYSTTADFRAGYREVLIDNAKRLGLPANLLGTLDPTLAAIARANDAELQLGTSNPPQPEFDRRLAAIRLQRCRDVHSGLAAAYRLFGEERFKEFLYTAVARSFFETSFSPTSREELARLAGGCR
jgi:hypothetical protein